MGFLKLIKCSKCYKLHSIYYKDRVLNTNNITTSMNNI